MSFLVVPTVLRSTLKHTYFIYLFMISYNNQLGNKFKEHLVYYFK